VNESIDGRVNAVFTDAGKVSVKNIDRRIHIWKWRPSDTSNARVQEVAGEQPPSKAPSIAVLPFTNMSGDTEQDYFSDGITDDILTDLSKLRGLLVIARNSTFAYKGKNVDIRTIGRELGVGGVLEGSIRRVANRVRITAQLIDAGTGGHLWAERYDRDLTGGRSWLTVGQIHLDGGWLIEGYNYLMPVPCVVPSQDEFVWVFYRSLGDGAQSRCVFIPQGML